MSLVFIYIHSIYSSTQNPNLPHHVIQVHHPKESGQFGSRYKLIIYRYCIRIQSISFSIIIYNKYHRLNELSHSYNDFDVFLEGSPLLSSQNKQTKNSRTRRSVRSFVPCIKGNRNEAVKVEAGPSFLSPGDRKV